MKDSTANGGKVEVGQPVPDFSLPGSKGRTVSLGDFRGKYVVIYFYPQDMTPTCTQESCDFRDYSPELKKLGAKIIGISPDDVKSHGKFIEKYELPFLLLADTERKVCELFDVWRLKKLYGREYMGVERSTFLIDPEGRLLKEWRKIRVKGHVQAVIDAIKRHKSEAGTAPPAIL